MVHLCFELIAGLLLAGEGDNAEEEAALKELEEDREALQAEQNKGNAKGKKSHDELKA